MNDRVSISVSNHVAHVKLNRPEKMNALDSAMFEGIFTAGEEISKMPDVRAVVLSGEGPSFCAGLDMENFSAMLDPSAESTLQKLETRTHGLFNDVQYVSWVWRELSVPVIAALHGVTIGGGLQIALGADMRYAAPDTRLSILEIKWGLVPDMGGSQLLRGILRDDVMRELSYTGRMVAADEAKSLGLITDIVENPVAHALELAKTIAEKNPDAIRGNKELYNKLHYQDIAQGMLHESVIQDEVLGKPNQIEAVMANLQKRQAEFKN